jgi:hypothetical protein
MSKADEQRSKEEQRIAGIRQQMASLQRVPSEQALIETFSGKRRPLAEGEPIDPSTGFVVTAPVPESLAASPVATPPQIPEASPLPPVALPAALADLPAGETPPITEIRSLELPTEGAVPKARVGVGPGDALLEQIAQSVAAFRPASGSKRKAIAVSKDVFSRVSYLAYEKGVDKVAVLTYLLDRYLPEDKSERQPRWLSHGGEAADRLDYLSYLEDPLMAKKFRWVQVRYGLSRVHDVERIVLAHLPASPIQIPAKQRHKGGYALPGPRR